jgi:penicillin-binding protein 1A
MSKETKERKNRRQQHKVPVKHFDDKKKVSYKVNRSSVVPKGETKLRIRPGFMSLLVCLGLLGVFFLIGYLLFGGLIGGAVIAAGFLFVWLIGRILDKPKTKSKKRIVLKIIIILVLLGIIVALLAGCWFIYYVVKNAPDFKQELLKEKESTIMYDSQGREYAKLGLELRENIEYDQLSESFVDALIATEDSRFFQHNGFDLMRFVKAALGQAVGQGDSGGGSTLTMQLSKNTFTSKDATGFKGIVRKFTDIYISIFQIEKNYTKEQIIEFYANNHNLSGTIYGVQEASRYFFNKEAKDLTITEAAIIVGMYQAPTSYNPFNKPQAAEKRRNTVLYLMERHGYITAEERKIAASIPIESLLTDTAKPVNEYQGYIDLVCNEVMNRYGVDPYTTPMLVYTNMIRSSQDGINKIYAGKTSYKWKDSDMQAGIAAVDSTSGKIIAIGAGRNRSGAKSFSYATFDEKSQRQIGSTAKPLFDYGPGIEYNNWSTYQLFDDKPYTYSNGKPIHNVDNAYKGIITLRTALSNSRNIPALKAFQQVDNKKIVDFVTSVGITPEISNGTIHEAHAIGAFTGSNPLSMAGAYQVFSNGGYYYEPYSVNKIVFREDNKTLEYSSPKVKVLSDSTAYMITDVLKGVLNLSYSSRKVKSDLPNDKIAAKTGTTNVDSATIRKRGLSSSTVRDFWIIGYTHNVVIGVWVGYAKLDKKHYLHFSYDGNRRFQLLSQAGKVCFKHDGKDFKRPSSVVSVTVEKGSNPAKLPSSSTPSDQLITELWKKGTEPTEVSTKYLAVGTPGNLSVADGGTYATFSWSGVADPGYVENGVFGYYVYFNGEKLYFTQNTSYTFSNMSSYYGTYGVRAGYKDTNDSISDLATYTYKEKVYKLTADPSSKTYYVGEEISHTLYDGSIVKVYTDNVDITTYARINNIKITDKNGNQVTYISSGSPNTYKVTYSVSHGTYSGTVSNTIIVKEKPAPTPESTPQSTPQTTPHESTDNNG